MPRQIEIPLIGGMNTTDDPEQVGTGFVELINVSGNTSPQTKFKDKTSLQEWQGFGAETVVTAPTSVNHNVINNVKFWYPNPQYFFVYDNTTKKVILLDTSFVKVNTSGTVGYFFPTNSAGDTDGLVFANTNPTPYGIKIYNYGDIVRFANSIFNNPVVTFKMPTSRKLFHSNENVPDYTVFSDFAHPRSLNTGDVLTDVINSGWFSDGSSFYADTHDLSSKTYYYKYSLIYDGNQESPLTNHIGDTADSSASTYIPQLTIDIQTGTGTTGFNPRISGINIYRSQTFEGGYYKIGSVSTLSPDPNRTTIENSLPTNSTQDGDFIQLNTNSTDVLTGDYTNKKVCFNGFIHTISGTQQASAGIYELSTPMGQKAYDGQGATKSHRLWRDEWTIIESNLMTDGNAGDFEGTINLQLEGWTSSNVTLDGSLCQVFNPTQANESALVGTNVLYLGRDPSGGSDAILYTDYMAIDANTEYHLEIFVAPDPDTPGIVAGDLNVAIGFGTSNTASNLSYSNSKNNTITVGNQNSSTYTMGNGKSGWEKIVVRGTSGASDTRMAVRFKVTDNSRAFLMDCMRVGKLLAEGEEGFGGLDVILSHTANLGYRDSHKGYVFLSGSGGNNSKRGWIIKSARYALQMYYSLIYTGGSTFPINSGQYSNVTRLIPNYVWRKNGTRQILNFYDKGLVDGVVHPFGETINEVNYTYSQILNGRNFVGNVMLDPSTTAEVHRDWVMFSELNQYDNIPITNFIQLQDLQGGDITGMATILNDLVIFMERGVFRLSVPTATPSEWTLAEAYENVGCVAPKSIVEYNGGVFFLARDNYYYIDPNFNLIPIGTPIQDIIVNMYNGTVADNVEAHIDIEHNKLLLIQDAVQKVQYYYHLKDGYWREEKWNKDMGGSDVYGGNYFIDKDNITYFVSRINTGGHFRRMSSVGGNLDMDLNTFANGQGGEIKTGLIRIADNGKHSIIKRINMRMGQSGNHFDVNLLDESGATIYSKTNEEVPSTNGRNMSFYVGARAELVQIQIKFRNDGDSSIERLHIEVD